MARKNLNLIVISVNNSNINFGPKKKVVPPPIYFVLDTTKYISM